MSHIALSHIKYDRDNPYAMDRVWNIWLDGKDWLSPSTADIIKDKWMEGMSKLTIPQMDWTKIVVNQL